jgi:hypothetical protein
VSLAQLLRQIVDEAIKPKPKGGDLTPLIGILASGEPSDVARDKDEYIGQAIRQHHERKWRRA